MSYKMTESTHWEGEVDYTVRQGLVDGNCFSQIHIVFMCMVYVCICVFIPLLNIKFLP